ncbi:hypothetical protein FUT84_01270 [Treponema phagedenis]|uniref:hypothetical protein n=1 Tax=Treponema phagedenis TaxID=162 RepID=UPI0011E882C3|nr:hypothetical protein [Treponema phagedenis]QEJ95205.1 hypothetical protein FUT79_08340 [Treponema phagedenis]QEJ99940.1 hypothetical protein FUT84_01270 [Treponema phagedenis]
MAYGLGKNSPVTLALGKESYEAMIERHGQYVRWRVAKKCPCVSTGNQPDIHCKKCGGSGELYSYQKKYTDNVRLSVFDGLIELPEDIADCVIKSIYNYAGVLFEFKKEDRFIQLQDKEHTLTQGETVDIIFEQELVCILKETKAERICKGFYRIPDLRMPKSTIEGVYYSPCCDILKIENLKSEDGADVEILNYYKDCIEVLSEEDYPYLIAKNIEYIKPVKFIVLSQNLNKENLALIQKHNGDAVCTFPYKFDVSEGDIITIISGTMTNKVIVKRGRETADDIIPEFFVDSIDLIETKTSVFKEGEDFILIGTNRIHWLGAAKPEANESMSITYRYNPTYRVCQNIPSLRTSEDQRIPRKVVLKLFASYQNARRVHTNG